MELSTATDAQLLGRMAEQGRDPDEARAAWSELYRRHVRYLHAIVARTFARQLGGQDGVADLVVDTFQRAFEWAGRQRDASEVVERFDHSDPNLSRRKILAWLAAIAEHLFVDRLRQRESKIQELLISETRWLARIAQDAPWVAPERIDLLERLIAKLTPVEADALRVSLPWYDPDTKTFVFPPREAARIAHSLGTTPEALRQRRHRALKHLEAELRRAGQAATGQKT